MNLPHYNFLSKICGKMKPIRQTEKLDAVTATIVNELGSVGVYHYNKLTYLFEYFFIKNFGKRYTGEKFLKFPHGPVIKDYKKQISNLYAKGYYNTDIEKLNEKRAVDEDYCGINSIEKTDNLCDITMSQGLVYDLLLAVINKYANMSILELEHIVYRTEPVVNLKHSINLGWKKETGSYVLAGDCIKISNYQNKVSKARSLVMQHEQNYPTINTKLQNSLAEEFLFLQEMRPGI